MQQDYIGFGTHFSGFLSPWFQCIFFSFAAYMVVPSDQETALEKPLIPAYYVETGIFPFQQVLRFLKFHIRFQ